MPFCKEDLIAKGKYVKRLDLGFTAATPTIQFFSQQIYEERDLKNSRQFWVTKKSPKDNPQPG